MINRCPTYQLPYSIAKLAKAGRHIAGRIKMWRNLFGPLMLDVAGQAPSGLSDTMHATGIDGLRQQFSPGATDGSPEHCRQGRAFAPGDKRG